MDSTTAVGSTQTAEQFLKTVKRRTRRKFTAEEKIRILLEGMKREVSTAELCRTESIHRTSTTPGSRTSWRAARRSFSETPGATLTIRESRS